MSKERINICKHGNDIIRIISARYAERKETLC